nr:BrnT family toxin [uncultured Desulfobacter sp.]
MKIIWDESKRQSNIVKHGLDFAQAHMVFAGATFTFEDTRMDYGEQRFVTIGL